MKKSLLIFSAIVTTLGLTAFGFGGTQFASIHPENQCNIVAELDRQMAEDTIELVYSDFFYDLGPRFSPIKKEALANAHSILDFLDEDQMPPVDAYKSVTLIIVEHERRTDKRASGKDDVLTAAQSKLLKSFDYSTHFVVRAEFEERNEETGELEDRHYSPHLTIVPEKQAYYVNGKEELIAYLTKNNKENTANLDEKMVRPAKLHFTVSKKGEISNIMLDNHSGYKSIDKTMIKLLKNAPGKWAPAENARGEKVDQDLVISFGLAGGC